VITHPAYAVEPWCLRETGLDLDVLAQSESVFALSNGHIGWRGNLDEGEPNGLPGTYLNGVFEARPLPYAEAGYGYPEVGQTIINVTNGKLVRLLVEDQPFDVRYGHLRTHAQRCPAAMTPREPRWLQSRSPSRSPGSSSGDERVGPAAPVRGDAGPVPPRVAALRPGDHGTGSFRGAGARHGDATGSRARRDPTHRVEQPQAVPGLAVLPGEVGQAGDGWDLAEQRRTYLDELQRRDPAGFDARIASGARAAGGPSRYLSTTPPLSP
jgi:hypothetical protein